VTINSPEAIEAVEWLVDLYTNPEYESILPTGVLSWTDTSNNEAFLGGTVGYTQNAGTVYASAVANELEIAQLISYHAPCGGPVNQEFNGLGGMYCHLIKGAKNAEGGRGLIMSFFTDEIMQDIFGAAVNYAVPAYNNQWEWEVLTSQPISIALKPVAQDPSGWNGLAWPGPSTAQIGAVGTANLHTDMVANVVTGQMTAAEAVANAEEQSIQIFKEFGAPGER
jgi:multiple sugar transport system substrate-binding protein